MLCVLYFKEHQAILYLLHQWQASLYPAFNDATHAFFQRQGMFGKELQSTAQQKIQAPIRLGYCGGCLSGCYSLYHDFYLLIGFSCRTLTWRPFAANSVLDADFSVFCTRDTGRVGWPCAISLVGMDGCSMCFGPQGGEGPHPCICFSVITVVLSPLALFRTPRLSICVSEYFNTGRGMRSSKLMRHTRG